MTLEKCHQRLKLSKKMHNNSFLIFNAQNMYKVDAEIVLEIIFDPCSRNSTTEVMLIAQRGSNVRALGHAIKYVSSYKCIAVGQY